ncbi:hypothetical protein CKAH01_16235 [Colletotrichum kahawae]|uniref:Uncharacterized protein n=1 Tax=Colletotrichum kahawae TaxID=34407 RepID=A0AAD9YGS1_COLKA|nr:hypothetical protein CKAH01_16235 [Colletotrichum kahawae]
MSNTSFCHAIDCYNLTGDFLEPYGDISGTGVLVGFIGTAYLVFLLVTVSYFLAFDPGENPFKGRITADEDAENPRWKPNPIHQRLIAWLRKPSLLMPSTRERLRAAFDEAIILLCDIQIVTGIGILVSGYMLLKCGLDACHWQIVVYLAWFSTVTHLSGLNISRGLLNTTPWAKYVRVFLMLALLVLVNVGLLPTGFFNSANFSSQAIYYFNQNPVTTTAEWQAMTMSVILLIFGFVSRSFKLFQPLSTAFRVQVRRPTSRLAQRTLQRLGGSNSGVSPSWRDKLKLRVVTRPALATFLMVRLSCDLFSSTIFEVYWLFVILLWGTVKVLAARNTISSMSPEVALEEKQWTFGQVLPVFLLLGPLFGIAGIFASKMTQGASNPARQYGRGSYIIGMNLAGRHTQLSNGATRSVSFNPLEVTTQEALDLLEPPPAPGAAIPISNPSEADLMHLKDYSDAQWLPICAAVPFLSIVVATIWDGLQRWLVF